LETVITWEDYTAGLSTVNGMIAEVRGQIAEVRTLLIFAEKAASLPKDELCDSNLCDCDLTSDLCNLTSDLCNRRFDIIFVHPYP